MSSNLVLGLAVVVLVSAAPHLVVTADALEAVEVFRGPLYDYKKTADIIYSRPRIEAGRASLKLDLYQPTGPGVPRLKPAMIFMHGGGWSTGSKSSGSQTASQFARRGYVAVSIDYRLREQKPVITDPELRSLVNIFGGHELAHAIVAAMEDMISALRWMRDYETVLGIDTSRIAIGGSSAGAITSIMTANCPDNLSLNDVPHIAVVMNLWGGWLSYWDSAFDMKSYVSPGEPPCISVHGSEDNTVAPEQSIDYHKRLSRLGIDNLLMINDGAGHGWGENPIFTMIYDGQTEFQNIIDFFYDAMDLQQLDPRAVDIDGDGTANFQDFAILAARWLDTKCGQCDGADLTGEGNVDIDDLRILARNWLAEL